MMDYSDTVTITVTRVHLDGKPTHWEVDVLGFGATGPTLASVIDAAYDILMDGPDGEWASFDANERSE